MVAGLLFLVGCVFLALYWSKQSAKTDQYSSRTPDAENLSRTIQNNERVSHIRNSHEDVVTFTTNHSLEGEAVDWNRRIAQFVDLGFTLESPARASRTNLTWMGALASLGLLVEDLRDDEAATLATEAAYLWYKDGLFYRITVGDSCTNWIPLGRSDRMPGPNEKVAATIWHSSRPEPLRLFSASHQSAALSTNAPRIGPSSAGVASMLNADESLNAQFFLANEFRFAADNTNIMVRDRVQWGAARKLMSINLDTFHEVNSSLRPTYAGAIGRGSCIVAVVTHVGAEGSALVDADTVGIRIALVAYHPSPTGRSRKQ